MSVGIELESRTLSYFLTALLSKVMPCYNSQEGTNFRIWTMKSDVNKLLKKNEKLNQLDSVKVVSHVQRESGNWFVNTLMLEGYDVPFKYKRTKRYRNLTGSPVNLTYYPQTETVAGMEFETMKVVRLRRS